MADRKVKDEAELSPTLLRKLVGETLFEERTIQRWWRGEVVRPATKKALDEAAERLGIRK